MKQSQNPDCFAKQCLGHQKQLIARELRKIIKDNAWTQKHASDVMGISDNLVGFINRGDEWKVSLDSLYVAAVYAGLTINMGIVRPD